MQKIETKPRTNWQEKIQSHGLTNSLRVDNYGNKYHYWDEKHLYVLHEEDQIVEHIEETTRELNEKILNTVPFIIEENHKKNSKYTIGFTPEELELVEYSYQEFENTNPSFTNIAEKLEFSIDKENNISLYKTQCNSYRNLIETSVTQYMLLEESYSEADQYNMISENLVTTFENIKEGLNNKNLHLLLSNYDTSGYQIITTSYLSDCAQEAGLKTNITALEKVTLDEKTHCLLDVDNNMINQALFNYPIDKVLTSDYMKTLIGKHIDGSNMFEPFWKAVLQDNLVIQALKENYNDIKITPELYQEDGTNIVIDSWLIGNEPSGIGIREYHVNDKREHFVPHIVIP